MSVNKVIVIGNLGANPDIRALPSGQTVANFSLATTERFTDRNGAKQERTDWHRIVAFGSLADTCERFLSKAAKFTSRDGLLPASTKRRTEAANATGLKSWRGNFACSATAQMATRPRLKRPTTSRFSSTTRRESRESGSPSIIQITIGDYGNGHLRNRYREDNQPA